MCPGVSVTWVYKGAKRDANVDQILWEYVLPRDVLSNSIIAREDLFSHLSLICWRAVIFVSSVFSEFSRFLLSVAVLGQTVRLNWGRSSKIWTGVVVDLLTKDASGPDDHEQDDSKCKCALYSVVQ